jgi:hypothetical protein
MKVLDLGGALFRWAAGAVVPMFARPVRPVPPAWFLHLLLVGGSAVGLYFAQPYLGVTVNVGRGPGWFRPYWLPALFLLGYSLVWTVVWLWRALAPNQPVTHFPDLDAAWAEVQTALEKAGIGIADTPLFLVFGDAPAGYEPVFRALPHGLAVAGGTNPASPLRVYANRDGIYLTLPGASLLGVREAGDPDGDAGDGDAIFQSIGINASVGIGQSVGADGWGSIGASIGPGGGGGGPIQEIQRIIRQARTEDRPLTEDEKQRVRALSAGGNTAAATGGSPKAVGSVLQNSRLVAASADRLTHVCGLIAAARWPLCPVNGAILAVPVAAAEKDEHAQQWGLVAREDLTVAEAGLKLRFPVYTLVGGVEDLPGGQLFFERFGADKGGQRLGKGFPLNPEVRPADSPAAVETVVNWVFEGLLPHWVFRLMRVDPAAGSDSRDNANLVRFLAEVRRRGPHLARLVSRAVARGDQTPEFGGCYLSVVAQADPHEARFTREFFRKVESTQGYVAWTDAAFADDAGYRSMTRLGYAALGLVLTGVLAFAGYVVLTKWVWAK